MLQKKKKLSKKEIKEDKLINFYKSSVDFFEKYQLVTIPGKFHGHRNSGAEAGSDH